MSITPTPERTLAARLPEFPWDVLAPSAAIAKKHPDGIVDLSIGTPVDPVPDVIRRALSAACDFPGYPQTRGTSDLRAAAAGWLARRHGVQVSPDAVLPVIGTKEIIAWLPTLLGCGPADAVCFPELAYPTYGVGARLAGTRGIATDRPDQLDQADAVLAQGGDPPKPPGVLAQGGDPPKPPGGLVRLAWVNSPSNPTGRVLPESRLSELVTWARDAGTVLASDECYIDLGFEATPISVLHPAACGGKHDGLIGVFSLSKRSNLAGYRAGFVTGDPSLVAELLEVHKHSGMIMPAPVQAAMTAALTDDAHAEQQFTRYASRRTLLRPALERAGWAITASQAGLYLWAEHPHRDCWESVRALADLGILVAPGAFYGAAGSRHVRVALTATDERIAAAVKRLDELS